jgi:hypothetical protein
MPMSAKGFHGRTATKLPFVRIEYFNVNFGGGFFFELSVPDSYYTRCCTSPGGGISERPVHSVGATSKRSNQAAISRPLSTYSDHPSFPLFLLFLFLNPAQLFKICSGLLLAGIYEDLGGQTNQDPSTFTQGSI